MQLVSNPKVNPLETTVSGYLVCNQGNHSSVITTNQFYSVTICLSTLSGVFTSIMFLTAAVTALFFISVEL